MRVAALLVAASLLTTCLFAQSTPLHQAITMVEQSRWDDARKALTPLAAHDPEAQYWLGRVAVEQNRADEGLELLEKSLAAAGNRSDAHLWLGNAYGAQALKAGMIKQAMLAPKVRSEYERAVQLDPNNLDARERLIQFYLIAPGMMGGSVEKARTEAAEIRKRDSLRGHRSFATIAMNQKDPAGARRELQTAVKEQPASPAAHLTLASFYMNADKNFKAAEEELQTAMRLDPSFMPIHARIGQLAQATKSNLQRGEESLKKYLAYTPKPNEPSRATAFFWLGGVYEAQGRKADAKQAYLESLKLAPGAKQVNEALKRVS